MNSTHTQIFFDMQGMTKKDLKMQLSSVQKEVYRNSTKRQIIAQIRLNIIVASEQIEKGGQNE